MAMRIAEIRGENMGMLRYLGMYNECNEHLYFVKLTIAVLR